jgi:hypothetical protein
MINPYAAPGIEPIVSSAERVPRLPGRVVVHFGRWLLICGTSGGTSFAWGLSVSDHPLRIPAMAFGIVLYALGYTVLDRAVLQPRMAASRLFRRAFVMGFAIRILCSLIFPVGLMIDMFPGVLSVGVAQHVFGGGSGGRALLSVGGILAATLLQGLLLNCILWTLIALIYGIFLLLGVAVRDPQAVALAS